MGSAGGFFDLAWGIGHLKMIGLYRFRTGDLVCGQMGEDQKPQGCLMERLVGRLMPFDDLLLILKAGHALYF